MKARDIIGKRIVEVRQQRTAGRDGSVLWSFDALTFDDGSMVSFRVVELENDYAIAAEFLRPTCGYGLTHDLGICDCGKERR